MGRADAASRTSRAGSAPGGQGLTHVWAVVLAGGEGARLRSLIRGVFPEERPKQYVPLMGPVSLFRQTLDRVARLVPTARTVVVLIGALGLRPPWMVDLERRVGALTTAGAQEAGNA